MTCKAMVDALLDADKSRVGGYGARFAGVVFPGETLKASIWKDGEGFRAVVTAPERDDAVALSDVELMPVVIVRFRFTDLVFRRGRVRLPLIRKMGHSYRYLVVAHDHFITSMNRLRYFPQLS